MRFISIVIRWLTNQQTDLLEQDIKKAVLKSLILEFFNVALISFWLGMMFAIHNPEAANNIVNIFEWLSSFFST